MSSENVKLRDNESNQVLSENTKEEWHDISRLFQLFKLKRMLVWGVKFIIRY